MRYEPVKPSADQKEEKVPASKRLRPFFFMRKIEKTISDGAFLSDSLYVPKYIWYQKQAKIPEIDKKLHYFDGLKKEFQKVSILFSKNVISKDKNVSAECRCSEGQALIASFVGG